jgi:hypothetical protein
MIIPSTIQLKSDEILPFHVERDQQDYIVGGIARNEGILILRSRWQVCTDAATEDYPGVFNSS